MIKWGFTPLLLSNKRAITVITSSFSWVKSVLKDESLSPIEQLYPLAWPASQLNEALHLLAQKLGLSVQVPLQPPNAEQQKAFNEWLKTSAEQLGMEIKPILMPYPDLEQSVCEIGPALLHLPNPESSQDEARFLILLKKRARNWVLVLCPARGLHWIRASTIRAALCYSLEAPRLAEIEELLNEIAPERQPQARRAILRDWLIDTQIDGFWLLRLSPHVNLWRQLRQAGLLNSLSLYIACVVAQEILFIGVLGLIGQAILQARLEWSMLLAGMLLFFCRAPIVLMKRWIEMQAPSEFGNLLKARLFAGVLRLDLEQIKPQGIGHFLMWAIESQILEEEGISRAALVLEAIIQIIVIAIALILFGESLVGGFLLAWLALAGWFSWRLLQPCFELNHYHADMTSNLLERLRGHLTRLVQERNWYHEDDKALTDYLPRVKKYDQKILPLWVVIPYGWLILMLLVSAVPFISGPDLAAQATLGIRLAALLYGFEYFQDYAWSMAEFARAIVAWRLIAPIQRAAGQTQQEVTSSPTVVEDESAQTAAILQGRDLLFRYQEGGRAILSGCHLDIYAGDRLLLEGPSGSGKSTLAGLLTGLHLPESGVLLLWGLNRHTISNQEWRQRIVAAPQFHENHVLNASLAFNLLMGHSWPPEERELSEAESICRELGLTELLERMPLGLDQMVGEAGWRLSHGERSRLYIARALLQKADLIILDESFASLDPKNMQIALQCVLKRARTLLVIAHP